MLMEKPLNQHEELEKEILDILANGIEIGRSVEEFIYSSTGMVPDPAFLETAISGESSEYEAAVDLIFFPDDDARIRVERVIPRSFDYSDEKNLIGKIISSKPLCTLRFAGSGSSLTVSVPERFSERFIRRLNLATYLPERLHELVGKYYAGKKYLALKDIRAKTGIHHSFDLLMDFLENISDIFPPEIEDLDTIMAISGMFPEETGIVSAINLAYIKWESSLKKHEDMEVALASGCMEELLSRGVRIQAINRDNIERKMAAAGRIICLLGCSPLCSI